MKSTQVKFGGIIVIVIILVIGMFVLVNSRNNSQTTSSSSEAAVQQEQLDLDAILANLKSQFPTVKETKVYTEANDPNTNLGKPGMYVAGAAFYDERTGEIPTDNWGTDAGGSIEVYANANDAKKRAELLESYQQQGNALVDPGAFKQVDKVIIRASSTLPKSQQDEIIVFLTSQVQ